MKDWRVSFGLLCVGLVDETWAYIYADTQDSNGHIWNENKINDEK